MTEMNGRGLTWEDVNKQQAELRDLDAQTKNSTMSFRGFGTTLYGKRDFNADGSYVTTKWGILFWLPLFPIQSMRIKPTGVQSGGPPWPWITYTVLSVSRPAFVQVLAVYFYVIGLFTLLINFGNFNSRLHWSGYFLLAAYLALPYLARFPAKRRAQETS